MKKTMVISCISVFIGVNAQNSTFSENDASLSSNLDGEVLLTIISVVSSLVTLYESLYLRIGPQDTALEDILEVVKRLENVTTTSAKIQHLNNEEFILRSLHDMNATKAVAGARRSELSNSFIQTVFWLQKARELDGNIFSLTKGLLGQLITGNDLMETIRKSSKCNLAATRKEMQRLLNLIISGSRAVYHFAHLGYMPQEEINFRRQAFSARYSEVFQKSEGLYRECLKVRLSHIIRWTKKKTTDHIADKIANKLSEEHSGEALQFVIAVYRDFGYPMKTKSSARHVIANQDGVHVAVFPLEGSFRKSVNSNLVDEFCNTSIPGAGDKTFCDVGSVDGVFVYDRLRNEEIVPLQSELAVIPKAGRLAVRKIPPQSLSGLHLKSYPDFDILLF